MSYKWIRLFIRSANQLSINFVFLEEHSNGSKGIKSNVEGIYKISNLLSLPSPDSVIFIFRNSLNLLYYFLLLVFQDLIIFILALGIFRSVIYLILLFNILLFGFAILLTSVNQSLGFHEGLSDE